MGAASAPAHHDGRGSRVEHLLAASWCATVAPERADRADLPGRRRALRWVAGLLTRNGTPRAFRIAACGRPAACVRDGDWQTAWVHRYCRDRACPACAQQRSRQMAVSLRKCADRRAGASLHFVTLTRPRSPHEGPGEAWNAYQRAWEAVRHRPEFKALAGGVRVVEVTYADKGWHVHCHAIFELKAGTATQRVVCPACEGTQRVRLKIRGQWRWHPCKSCGTKHQPGDGTMPVGLADLIRAWAEIVEGSTAAQCAVPLDERNAGQLAKYLTKQWELPDDKARALFSAAVGRRLHNTFGTWRGVSIRLKVDPDARRWWLGPLLADIEKMHPRSYVHFEGTVPVLLEPMQSWERNEMLVDWKREPRELVRVELFEGPTAAAPCGKARLQTPREKRGACYRPTIPIVRMTVGALLRRLREDDRRADQHDAAAPDLPMPGRERLLRSAAGDGPWSSRYCNAKWRSLQRGPTPRVSLIDFETWDLSRPSDCSASASA